MIYSMTDSSTDHIPADFPVKVLGPNDSATDRVTCGVCGRSWDDAIPTARTPVPAGRCPFEEWHDQTDDSDGPGSELISVHWNDTARQWTIYCRRSPDHDWDRFEGDEAELDTLWSIARDVVTGG